MCKELLANCSAMQLNDIIYHISYIMHICIVKSTLLCAVNVLCAVLSIDKCCVADGYGGCGGIFTN